MLLASYIVTSLTAVLLLLFSYVMHQQMLTKGVAFKNYRYYLHFTLTSLFAAYLLKVTDILVVRQKQDIVEAKYQETYGGYCAVSGGAQIFLEAFAYLNLISYLVILRMSVAEATLNFSKVKAKYTAFSIGTSAVILTVFATCLKLGVNSVLLCGLRYMENRPYLEMLRNW